MQGGEIQNAVPNHMTLPSPLLDTPPTSDNPNVTSSPRKESSECACRVAESACSGPMTPNLAGILPPGRLAGNLPKEVLAQQALLAKKLRLSKILSREVQFAAQIPQKTSVVIGPFDEEDIRGDIRVLSPSLVNSQVLPKTRPLSPEPIFHLKPDTQNENLISSKLRWKEPGGRRKQEACGKGGKEDSESKNEDKEGTKGKGRGRRRPRIFKLKFHHQALPPEYLDHYEASLRQEQRHGSLLVDVEGVQETKSGPREMIKEGLQSGLRQGGKTRNGKNQRNTRPITIHEAGGAATEALLRDLLLANPHLQQAALQQAAMARAQSVPSIMLSSTGSNQRLSYHHMPLQSPSPDSSMGAEDRSSYASDMSVDEFPKKSRKSKKSDAKVLMGHGLGGMGLGNTMMDNQLEKSSTEMAITESTAETLSGLHLPHAQLDKESLARSKSYAALLIPPFAQNEPLNLCVRDESANSSNLCSYGAATHLTQQVKTEPVQKEIGKQPESKVVEEPSRDLRLHCSPPPDYQAWNFGAGYTPQWIHDYRLKTEDGLSSGQSTPSLCSQSSHMPCMSPPTWPHSSPPPHPLSPAPPLSPLIPPNHPRHIQALLKESIQHKFEEATRERLSPRENLISSSMRSNRSSPLSPHHPADSPVKSGARRKRSALFIPPADPSTEVSICKFKFTGGANPVLEEKKRVSVDAGGTLRYFSGGDSLISRERRCLPSNVVLTGRLLENLSKCEKDVKKIRLESDTDDTCSLPGGGFDPSCSSATTSPTGTLEYGLQSPLNLPPPIEDSPKRKRRSKKSSVREKLEQTLREKGLLIQTQQVQSAEGATYCKFRQLRKITRYLFRSWKDYLPGQMQDGVAGEQHPDSRTSPVYHPSGTVKSSQTGHDFCVNRH